MTVLSLFNGPLTPKSLRPHQHQALAMLKRSLIAGNKRVVVQMPTGAGKTRLAAEIVSGALAKTKKVAFTVPAISLVDQTVAAFENEGIDAIGVIQADHSRTDVRMPVQVCSVQSLAKRIPPDADIVIVDECHLQFSIVRNWMKDQPEKVFVGLSATPWARGMADTWQDLLVPVRMQELIDDGFLAPFRAFAPSHPDLSQVKAKGADYHEEQLAEVMGNALLIADVVSTWKRLAEGRPTLVFAVNRAHAKKLQREFAHAGVRMGYCDAFIDRVERAVLFERMARGDLAGIVNVGTLTTGVDADVRCIVMARPTKSEMLFVQSIGRGLRTAIGKADCLILDHADNHARLGFVTDIHYDALLPGRQKNKSAREKGEPMPRECASCALLKPPKVSQCPSCGFKPEVQSDIQAQDGELVEIKRKRPNVRSADKQQFWSMALHVDGQRKKEGRLAKALYRSKFGVWPQGLRDSQAVPDAAFWGYERSRRIAYSKGGAAR